MLRASQGWKEHEKTGKRFPPGLPRYWSKEVLALGGDYSRSRYLFEDWILELRISTLTCHPVSYIAIFDRSEIGKRERLIMLQNKLTRHAEQVVEYIEIQALIDLPR